MSEQSKLEIGRAIIQEMRPTRSAAPSGPPRIPSEIRTDWIDFTAEAAFGTTWAREGLSRRDRSLITVSVLAALNCPDELTAHIEVGMRNGLSRQEVCEAIWHTAVYAGWPRGGQAFKVAEALFKDIDAHEAADSPSGDEPREEDVR